MAVAVPPTVIEGRIEYVFGSLIFITRWAIRWRLVGVRDWAMDDWFSVAAWLVSTAYFIAIEELGVYGAAVGLNQAERDALTPAMVTSFEHGSKVLFLLFGLLITLTWTLKATLITFFLRLTRQTKLYKLVLGIAGVAVAAFSAAIITWPTHCLPVRRHWQILPDPGYECSLNITTNIVLATGSALVDALLLVVPILLVRGTTITIVQKLLIIFLLSTGVFVIAIVITRVTLAVKPGPERVVQNSAWGNREILVTIFAVNVPIVHVLFKRETWKKMWGIQSRTYVKTEDEDTNRSGRALKGSKSSKLEIYKMTDIHMDSHESETKLVHGNGVPGAFLGSGVNKHGPNV